MRPVPVLRWSPSVRRSAEVTRDRIFFGIGTDEAFVYEDMTALNRGTITVNWRKPLRLEEINQMAPTEEVRMRPGRA